jgi:hypothetical protein
MIGASLKEAAGFPSAIKEISAVEDLKNCNLWQAVDIPWGQVMCDWLEGVPFRVL